MASSNIENSDQDYLHKDNILQVALIPEYADDEEPTQYKYDRNFEIYKGHNRNFINFTNNICNEPDSFIQKCIPSVPYCLFQSIRQACQCDVNCIFQTYTDANISEKCLLYNTNFNSISNQKEKCCWPMPRLRNEVSFRVYGDNLLEAKRDFYLALNKLCNDEIIFKNVRCAAYDLKTECLDDKDCIIENLKECPPTDCKNEKFNDQKKIIRMLFDIPDFGNCYNTRSVRSISTSNNNNNSTSNNNNEVSNNYNNSENELIRSVKKTLGVSTGTMFLFGVVAISLSNFKKGKLCLKYLVIICSLCLVGIMGLIGCLIK